LRPVVAEKSPRGILNPTNAFLDASHYAIIRHETSPSERKD
jgi:hypothetical protein